MSALVSILKSFRGIIFYCCFSKDGGSASNLEIIVWKGDTASHIFRNNGLNKLLKRNSSTGTAGLMQTLFNIPEHNFCGWPSGEYFF